MNKKILVLHGPNLNLLGKREPDKYGHLSSDDIILNLKSLYPDDIIDYYQSNDESDLINVIQTSEIKYDGVIINPGAFSHTSISIADAIKSVSTPIICVHISNIYSREKFRHIDYIGDVCKGSIVGLGSDGYSLAIDCLFD